MQMEFEFADRPRRETRIREAAAVLGLLENDQRVLLAALWEGKPMTIDGEPCSLLPWSVSTLAEQLGCGRSSAGDAVARLKRLGLIDNGRKKLLVCWAELDRRTMPDKRRTIPDDPGQAPDDPGRSRTIAGRSRTIPDDRRTIDCGDGKGIPFSGNGPPARLRTVLSDSNDVDDSLANWGECVIDPAEALDTCKRVRERLGISTISREAFDLIATAAVLSQTRLSPTWLDHAVRAASRSTSTNPIKYFKGCLRNGVAEIEGLCTLDAAFDVWGDLWRWAKPGVAALARHTRKKKAKD